MKKLKFFAGSAMILAIASAFAFKPGTTTHSSVDVTRYKKIDLNTCRDYTCGTSGTTSCNGLYQNSDCTSPISDGKFYTP